MYIFLVDYWVTGWDSEFGGLQCIIAENEDEVIKILCETVGEYYIKIYPDYKELITNCVRESKRYKLESGIRYQSGIVKEFIT